MKNNLIILLNKIKILITNNLTYKYEKRYVIP